MSSSSVASHGSSNEEGEERLLIVPAAAAEEEQEVVATTTRRSTSTRTGLASFVRGRQPGMWRLQANPRGVGGGLLRGASTTTDNHEQQQRTTANDPVRRHHHNTALRSYFYPARAPTLLRGTLSSRIRANGVRGTAMAPTSSSSVPSTTTTTTPSANNREEHLNVSCDECGEMPIIGVRYKSVRQPNYDVCGACLEENHSATTTDFVALETYRGGGTPVPTETSSGGRSVAVHSLYDLQGLIEHDTTVEDIAFYVGTATSTELGQTVRRVLKEHTSLKSVHIHIFGTEHSTETIQALAGGLEENKSVWSVSWNILSNRGQPAGLSKEACVALQQLLQNNTTIRYMFFNRQRGFGWRQLPAQAENDATTTDDDKLEDYVFDALAKTHLHTIRFAGHNAVSDDNKKKAWAAIMANPHLRRIKATFVTPDYQLGLLEADKKHKWMERWTHLDAKEDDRWAVLEEVFDSKFVDKVPVLFHFLRNQPECLLQMVPDDEEGDDDKKVAAVVVDDDKNQEYDETAWA